MEAIKVTGTVKEVLPLVEKGDFKKQDVIVETEGQYSQTFAIELLKEKVELADFLSAGDVVTFHCNLRGREWINPEGESKYFLSLNGWKVDK